MNLRLIICLLAIAFSVSTAQSQQIEDDFYLELQAEFELLNTNLESVSARFEELLIDTKILADASARSRKDYLQFLSKTDSFPLINFLDSTNADLRFKLSLQTVSEIRNTFVERGPLQFAASKFSMILQHIESKDLNDRARTSTIANAFLDHLDIADFEHPFYKALFFLALANMSDLNYRTLDYMLVEDADYERYFGPERKLPVVQERSIFGIAVNDVGGIRTCGKKLDNPSLLSEELMNFYTINRELTKKEAQVEIADKNSAGYNFPYYSNISIPEVEDKIIAARQDYLEALSQKEEVKFKRYDLKAWQNKKKLLLLYGKDRLPEIDPEAYILVNTGKMNSTLRLLRQEINQAFSELRNSESIVLYNESFDAVFLRHNFLLNDFTKLRLLEDLFPVRILVNPTISLDTSPPPLQEEIIEYR